MLSVRTSSRATDIDFFHADAEKKRLFLQSILDDDIKSGFFMVFCESQFCTENIRFVVATIKYARLYENDTSIWSPWETDLGNNLNGDKRIYNEMTPEKCAEVERDMQYIHNRFLKPSALYEICISQIILDNTERRMKEFHTYGPEVFKEARLDPMNTLIKDILPRFVVSPIFDEMKFYCKALNNMPPPNSLIVNPPMSAMSTAVSVKNKVAAVDKELAKLDTAVDVERYCRDDLEQYFVDALLYEYLLKYLNRIVSSENLLCIRAINIFPQLFEEPANSKIAMSVAVSKIQLSTKSQPNSEGTDSGGPNKGVVTKAVTNQAWLIYMYFLAPGACYEVGVSSAISRSVALNMAKPVRDMFEPTRIAATKVLQHHFSTFLESSEFKELVQKATERMQAGIGAPAKKSTGTFLPTINLKGWFNAT